MYHLAAILKFYNMEKLRNSQIVIPAASSQIPKCTTELKLWLNHVGHGQLSLIHWLYHLPDPSTILNFQPHTWNPHNLNVPKSYNRALKQPKMDCIRETSTKNGWYNQCITHTTFRPSWILTRFLEFLSSQVIQCPNGSKWTVSERTRLKMADTLNVSLIQPFGHL